MPSSQQVVDLLYANLGALPHEQYGVINLLPWAAESDATNALKRQVCEGIANVLTDAGYIASESQAPQAPSRSVTLNCRLCSATLLTVAVGNDGTANVPAQNVITAVARMRPECPHDVVTPDDQRRAIEQAVLAARQESQGSN